MSPTELNYEVMRWMKINPKPVTEPLHAYLARVAEFFYDFGRQDGYTHGIKDGEAKIDRS
jgi:hypothetical protein